MLATLRALQSPDVPWELVFVDNNSEDTDVLIRASLLGFAGYYVPSVVVFHHHWRRLTQDVTKLYRGYAYGRGALSMKTVMGSQAQTMYFQNWYWRLRSLLRQGHGDYCMYEFRGATRFFLSSLGRSRPATAASQGAASVPDIWRFEGEVHGAARLTSRKKGRWRAGAWRMLGVLPIATACDTLLLVRLIVHVNGGSPRTG